MNVTGLILLKARLTQLCRVLSYTHKDRKNVVLSVVYEVVMRQKSVVTWLAILHQKNVL